MLRWLGKRAYGVYLIHQAIQGLLFGAILRRSPAINNTADLATVVAAVVLTMTIASISWRFFESPLIAFGHRSVYLPREAPKRATLRKKRSTAEVTCDRFAGSRTS
jgi:peptidoglycan/LPS O-acetylase OafA/YrhL